LSYGKNTNWNVQEHDVDINIGTKEGGRNRDFGEMLKKNNLLQTFE
jgi:hypothetical protein